MKQWVIELYTNQCTIHELWEFIEDSLSLKDYPYPMYWVTKRVIEKHKKKGHIYLAMQGKKMVGCLIIEKSNIEILCVRKRYKLRGIGESLVKHVEQILQRDKRRKYIRVDSMEDFKAKPFYERLGFKDYKSHEWDHCWHLQKSIGIEL
jgi:ribosomal protein S18 acetylase RimI-like enzyme